MFLDKLFRIKRCFLIFVFKIFNRKPGFSISYRKQVPKYLILGHFYQSETVKVFRNNFFFASSISKKKLNPIAFNEMFCHSLLESHMSETFLDFKYQMLTRELKLIGPYRFHACKFCLAHNIFAYF